MGSDVRSHRARWIGLGLAAGLVAGTAGGALAGSGHLATFQLGVTNTISGYVTALAGSSATKLLQVTNTSTSATAAGVGITTAGGTGLQINVPVGRAPLTVSVGAGKATNLNADLLDGVNSTGFARSAPLVWTAVKPVVLNAPPGTFHCVPHYLYTSQCDQRWFNAPGFGAAAYAKDPFGIVHLKGVVSCTSTSSPCDASEYDVGKIYTLPVGYRPAATTRFASWAGDGAALISIRSTGEVMAASAPFEAVYQSITLDGITFPAAP